MWITQDLSSLGPTSISISISISTPILILINFNVYVAAVTVARQKSWDGFPGGSEAAAKMIMSN